MSTGASYQDEIARKHELVDNHQWGKRIYLAVAILDYRLQLAFKLFRSRSRELVVADRYAFDVAVNFGLALNLAPAETVELAQRLIAHVPLPQVRIFLRVEPEISMQRKDDIPDIEYLRLRFAHYEAIAKAFGFITLDGIDPIAENCARIQAHTRAVLTKPHVHYVHANNSDVGGADLVQVAMAKHMRSSGQGYETTVSLRLPTKAARAHAEAGTPVLLAPVVRPQIAAGPRGLFNLVTKGPATLVYFFGLFGREKPDIVHVNDLYEFLPAIAARLRGIPVVYHIRMIKSGPLGRAFSYLIPKISTSVISVSEAVREVYDSDKAWGCRHHVIHDLANSTLVGFSGNVLENQSRPVEIIHGKRLVVMVGRIEEWKGQHIFLEAIAQLPTHIREENAFVLVGGGVPGRADYLQGVIDKATSLGVQWLGPRDNVPEIMLASDISVHCSIDPDPFPGVVIESLLAGAATIGTAAGGVPEIINSADVGLLYPPGEAAILARHLQDLLTQDQPPRTVYSLNARTRALALVSPESVDAQIDSVYQSLLRDRQRKNNPTRSRPARFSRTKKGA